MPSLYLGVQVRWTSLAEGDRKRALIKSRFATRHYQMGFPVFPPETAVQAI
ncbi:hypothetical protein J5X98_04365 [Leptothermofonsia sichuanensis E412]|uniref:DUF4079 domain-containing protein n=1 Tax=Leptothermofonsia sichuanensis TaxID=2917832 RepID=UPI001CA7A4BC|nr:DUF4079 domain-containing protein [Leptothermofonsia sichuanensis]QZZ21697.1 hypothetical protein J5X98_04365 [Leptothermofonsia sichuanensis E412]